MAYVSQTLPGVTSDALGTGLVNDPTTPTSAGILDPVFGILDQGLNAFARFENFKLQKDLIHAQAKQASLLGTVEVPQNIAARPASVSAPAPGGGLGSNNLMLIGLLAVAALVVLR